ncbi:MAG: helix-turn-helix domain-containing protein [Paludibacteraceae bacterium]|nr:helix-turn-helix domain-containing protein [Paludibacteraceae bacterium]
MSDNNQIPAVDCPIDYLVGEASGKILNEYGRFPCKIMCGVYAYLLRGSAKATIDITDYHFHAGDFLLLQPGSFFLIQEFTEDAQIYYMIFSNSFLEKNAYSTPSTMTQLNYFRPVLHFEESHGEVIKGAYELVMKAQNTRPSMLTKQNVGLLYSLFKSTYIEYVKKHFEAPTLPQDRRTEILQEYSSLVIKHYHEWHHVSDYAEAMRLTLPHLCSTIKAVSGKPASELIVDAIITDAKAQLKISNQQVKEIALSLGFDNVAFFNRFFKTHVGLTPKAYRNS